MTEPHGAGAPGRRALQARAKDGEETIVPLLDERTPRRSRASEETIVPPFHIQLIALLSDKLKTEWM